MKQSMLEKKTKLEFGDFQTPLELAEKVCQKLQVLGIKPNTIIEPTCGVGAFVRASAQSFPSSKIIGLDINQTYLDELEQHLPNHPRVTKMQADFFAYDWQTLVDNQQGSILVLGNFPWVTNSRQGTLGVSNLPDKTNFQNHIGLEALTGKSNFDISEWMLIEAASWLKERGGYIAMLCKTSVARKFLYHLRSEKYGVERTLMFGINTQKYFNAATHACLFVCELSAGVSNYDCEVFETLDSKTFYEVGQRSSLLVKDIQTFEKLGHLLGSNTYKWRSGVKHDASEIMELQKTASGFVNGLGEGVDIETEYLFPLLKGSDVANGRTTTTQRYVLVTQQFVGEATDAIVQLAPKTWNYLETHATRLDNRKSRIYKDAPRFAMFGVGNYTFAPWKIAICSLYKKLEFRLIGTIEGKPVVFDDTVYFLGFETEKEAKRTLELLNMKDSKDFLNSLIFWDEKRPIKTAILNSLDLKRLEDSLVVK